MSEVHPSLEEILFDLAVQKPTAAERAAFLDHACRDNPALRATLDELLESHFGAGGFLPQAPPANRLPEAPTLADATPPSAEAPAQRLGRYKLLEKLGEGGFGDVWMAEQREPVKRRVALKIIKLGMDTRQVIARFEAERQALALMDHPNIAKVFDGGATESGRPYFVMELVRGVPITKFCDDAQFSTTQRLELFISVCQALQHAHQKGVIHRDIKPSNVMVTLHDDKPVVKVIDFGIAKATQQDLTDQTAFTCFHQFIGTPAYMSPEQAGLSGLDIDTRSDVYSLGVLLYELLTGKTPLDPKALTTGGLEEMRRRIQEVEAPRPSNRISGLNEAELTTIARSRHADPHRFRRQLRGDLDWVVLKSLEKDRTRRYETAIAFAEDLRRTLNNEPVSAVAPTAIYLFTKYARRHRTSLALAASIAALLVVGAVYSTAQAAKAREAAIKAGEAERLAMISLGTAEQERDRATQLATRLDGANDQLVRSATRAEFTTGHHLLEAGQPAKGIAHLARALRTDPANWPAATRLISTLTDRGFVLDDLPPILHDQPIYDHVLDRSTGLLVTRGLEYDLRVWKAWTAERLMDIPATGSRRMPSISADGKRFLYVDTNGLAQVFEPFTKPGAPLATLRAEAPIVDAVLSPAAGSGLKAATRQADGAIQIWDAESGIALSQPLTGSSTNGGFLAFTRDGQWLVASFSDGTVGAWPTPPQSGAARMIPATKGNLLTLAPDSKTLVERAADGLSVRFWDLASGNARGAAISFQEPLAQVPGEPGTEPLGTSHRHEFTFSDDGRQMLAIAHDTVLPYENRILHPRMEVHLFDVPAGRLLRTISETNVTFHDENLVTGLGAMILNTNRLVIRSLSTGKTLVDRLWPSDSVQAIRFSPAGDRILVALTDRRLILYDARTGDSLTHPGDPAHISHVAGGSGRTPGQTYFMRHRERIGSLEFSPEGEVFLTHDQSGALQLWDTFEGVPLSEPIPERSGNVQFSRDGRWLLVFRRSGGSSSARFDSSSIHLMGRDLSAARHRTLPYGGWAPVLHFSADGRYGLVGRNGLVVFSPSTGEVIRRIDWADTGRIGLVGSTTWLISEAWFSPSGEKIVAVCHDDTARVVKVFETATGKTLHTLPTPRSTLPYRARFAGENRVAIGSWTYEEGLLPLKIWDLRSDRIVAETKPAAGPYIFDVSPDGRRIASCDYGIALLDAADLQPVCPLLHHRNPSVHLYSIAFSPDSRWLITGSNEGTVRVWKTETGELEAEFEHGDWPRWVDVSPDSQRVVATGRGRYDVPSAANVWEFAGGRTRRVTSSLTHPNTIVHAKFSADSHYLLAGDRGGTVQLWDLETSLPMLDRLFADADGGVSRVGINPQMSRVFAATFSGEQLHQRGLPPRGVPVPDWLPPLAEAVAGQWINDRGALVPLGPERLKESKATVAQLPSSADSEDFYLQWARWFFADRATRAVAPLDSVTVPDEVHKLLAEGSLISLRRAHRISPTDARVFAALAREIASYEELREDAAADPGTMSAPEWYAAQAVERAPESLEVHWSQAEVLLRLGKPDAARRALDGATRLQADHPNVLAIQSELAWRDGQTNEAHALLARALSASTPNTTSAYLQFASIARRPDFFAEAALRNRTERRLAGRPLNLPAQFVDLTPWYTGAIEGSQTNAAKPATSFAAPVLEMGGTPFDLRGVVSLSTVPTHGGSLQAMLGIPVGQRAARLHFLGAGRNARGLRLRVHHADQQVREFRLTPTWAGNELQVVSWDNPRPEVPVHSIDVIALPNSEPRIAAITVQTEPDPVIATQPQPAYPRVHLGQPLELSVAVATPGTWSYQWSVNQQPIPGATNPVLRIASTTVKDLAGYQVDIRTTVPDPASRSVRSRLVWAVDAADPVARGILKEELYLDVPGTSVEDLLKSLKFPGRPDAIAAISALEAPQIPHDNFGRRWSGWLAPKESADYVFYLCSDDASRLALSTDETAGRLAVIARLDGHGGWRNWEALRPESISKPIRLEAGRRYFLEVLHKEGGWEDHVSIAWRKVGEPAPKNGDAPIGGEFLQLPVE